MNNIFKIYIIMQLTYQEGITTCQSMNFPTLDSLHNNQQYKLNFYKIQIYKKTLYKN